MATTRRHNVDDDIRVQLDGAVNDSVTTLTVHSGEATTLPTAPFYLRAYAGSEQVEVTAVNTGTEELTVVRGANSTTPAAHADDAYFDLDVVAGQITEIDTWLTRVEKALSILTGAGDGVMRYGNAIKAVASTPPAMTVDIQTGFGFVSNRLVEITAQETTAAIVAPAANPRKDTVQISQYGVVSIKTGVEAGSPSAPAVDANNMKLAEIYCRVGMVHIDDADDSSNGYLIDSRTAL